MPTPQRRRQLSLYVPPHQAVAIEGVRATVDPVQHRLIPAHITLCREDELLPFSDIEARLQCIAIAPLTLSFGRPVEFFAHGLLLPCTAGEPAFRALREAILNSKNIRDHKPHMTLAHPRNPKAPGNSLAFALQHLPATITLVLPSIALIAQEGDQPWRVLKLEYLFQVA